MERNPATTDAEAGKCGCAPTELRSKERTASYKHLAPVGAKRQTTICCTSKLNLRMKKSQMRKGQSCSSYITQVVLITYQRRDRSHPANAQYHLHPGIRRVVLQ